MICVLLKHTNLCEIDIDWFFQLCSSLFAICHRWGTCLPNMPECAYSLGSSEPGTVLVFTSALCEAELPLIFPWSVGFAPHSSAWNVFPRDLSFHHQIFICACLENLLCPHTLCVILSQGENILDPLALSKAATRSLISVFERQWSLRKGRGIWIERVGF